MSDLVIINRSVHIQWRKNTKIIIITFQPMATHNDNFCSFSFLVIPEMQMADQLTSSRVTFYSDVMKSQIVIIVLLFVIGMFDKKWMIRVPSVYSSLFEKVEHWNKKRE